MLSATVGVECPCGEKRSRTIEAVGELMPQLTNEKMCEGPDGGQ